MEVTEIQRGEATPRLDWKLTSFQYNTQAGALLGLEQIIKQVFVAQLCLTLCDPMDCSLLTRLLCLWQSHTMPSKEPEFDWIYWQKMTQDVIGRQQRNSRSLAERNG